MYLKAHFVCLTLATQNSGIHAYSECHLIGVWFIQWIYTIILVQASDAIIIKHKFGSIYIEQWKLGAKCLVKNHIDVNENLF